MARPSRCEIPGCPHQPVDTHEIYGKGDNGKAAMIPANQIGLCNLIHHTGSPLAVHVMGRESFAERFGLEDRFEAARIAVRDEKIRLGLPL